jgi:hypothetical protein
MFWAGPPTFTFFSTLNVTLLFEIIQKSQAQQIDSPAACCLPSHLCPPLCLPSICPSHNVVIIRDGVILKKNQQAGWHDDLPPAMSAITAFLPC